MTQKPKIDDAVKDLLDGENLYSALDFISYLKSNNIGIQWTNTRTWKAVKKGVPICYIKLGIVRDTGTACYTEFVDNNDSEKGSWVINPHVFGLENTGVGSKYGYEEVISNEKMIKLIYNKVRSCSNCGNTKKCAPGINVNFWGKELGNRCKFIAIPFLDPNLEELECVKMLINIYCELKSK